MSRFIVDAVLSRFSAKEEAFTINRDEQTHHEWIDDFHPTLKLQIEYMFSALNKEEKDWVVQQTEEQRSHGHFKRFSVEYDNWFMNKTLDIFKNGLYDDNSFGQRLKANWNESSKVLLPYSHVATATSAKNTLRFERSLAIQDDQNVFLVVDEKDKKWVLKWSSEEKSNGNAMTEELNYRSIQKHGGTTPDLLSGYYVGDFPVLVIEFLYALDVSDNPLEVGRQLLLQLKYIHKFALHLDLKPDNIRKRMTGQLGGGTPQYFIIDMDLCTNLVTCGPGPNCYKREHYTPFYASTDMDASEVAYGSYRHDLMELFYVINELSLGRLYRAKLDVFGKSMEVYYRQIYGLLTNDEFSNVEVMRTKQIAETARGERAIRMLLRRPVTFKSNVLLDFLRYIKNLPEYSIPEGVHDMIAESILKDSSFTQFLNLTRQHAEINCAICDTARVKTRCGKCYVGVTYLCTSVDCMNKHTCI